MQARKKGTDLERAIALIERTILNAVPALSDKSYKIYSRRIILVDGVKHEIDVWVEFDIGGGYKSIFIFETKNWRAKVGKNHPIIFSKKIEAAQAQHGFFVAKKLTKYAVAAAKHDRRITVLRVTDEFINSDIINVFHRVVLDASKMSAQVCFVSEPIPKDREPTHIDIETAVLNDSPINVNDYIWPKVHTIATEHVNTLRTDTFADGLYTTYDVKSELAVAPDCLVINGTERNKIQFQVRYQVEVIRPAIVSKYEVETRGRIYTFEPVKVGNGRFSQIIIVETSAE
jgi:hypothetical protein